MFPQVKTQFLLRQKNFLVTLYFSLQHPLHTWIHPSANHGPSCLTSVILRELVFPTWYCRSLFFSYRKTFESCLIKKNWNPRKWLTLVGMWWQFVYNTFVKHVAVYATTLFFLSQPFSGIFYDIFVYRTYKACSQGCHLSAVLRIRNDLFQIRIQLWISWVLDPDPVSDPDPTHVIKAYLEL